MKKIFRWWKNNHTVLTALWRRDIENIYAGTFLGFSWLLVAPIVYSLTLYLVFRYGLKVDVGGNTSYGTYLLAGLQPWLFISSYLNSSTTMLKQYSYLLKRANISVFVIPLVRLKTETMIHLILLCFLFIVISLEGVTPNWSWLRVIYYLFCTLILLISLGLSFSAISVFLSDVAKFVAILIQIGFWCTPIIWSSSIVPASYRWLIELNPAEYIVSGYRCSLLDHCKDPVILYQHVYFWGVTLVLLCVGLFVFRKLKPHFAEVV